MLPLRAFGTLTTKATASTGVVTTPSSITVTSNAASTASLTSPAADATGLTPVREGRNVLLGGNPIHHVTDWKNHTMTNLTLEGHWFHKGFVEHSFFRKNGWLYLETNGGGENDGAFETFANIAIGYAYFKQSHLITQGAIMGAVVEEKLRESK